MSRYLVAPGLRGCARWEGFREERGPTLRSRSGRARPVQLEDNLKALEVKLSAEQSAALDALTKPALDFPAGYMPLLASMHSPGLTINGEIAEPSPFSVTRDDKTY
jgi:hypothetical protein